MRRSHPRLHHAFPLLLALVAALGRPSWGQPTSAAGAAAAADQNPGSSQTAGTVNVLVLTPYNNPSLRAYALKVLAGLCLALSEAPDTRDASDDPKPSGPFIIRAGPADRLEPVKDAEALWPMLVRFSQSKQSQFHVTVGWPGSAPKPPAIRFCFRDEEEACANGIDCPSHHPCQIVFGPVASDAANTIIEAMRSRPGIPILTASATATSLTSPRLKSNAFYRFISPDQKLVSRLAWDLVHHVRARRIAVLYENTGYGRGLLSDFQRELGEEGYVDADRLPAFRYRRGLFSETGATPPASANQDKQRAQQPEEQASNPQEQLRQLGEFLVQLRLLGVDAVGLFGSLQDKQGILSECNGYQKQPILARRPAPLVFTTDADLGWESFSWDGSILIASLLDPHDPDAAEHATHAGALLAGEPVSGVQPDVYMLQARRAAQFLITVVRQMRQSDRSAAAVFESYRRAEPGRRQAGLSDPLSDSEVEFEPNGDLAGDLAEPQLLILKHEELMAIDSRPLHLDLHNPHLMRDLGRHPLGLYVITYLAALLAVLAGRFAGVWDEESPGAPDDRAAAHDGFPPLVYERGWLRQRKGWPDWLPYHLAAGAIFLVYAVIVTLERRAEVSFFPNEFSVLPTVCIQCHLAAVCLWYVAHMRAETWRLWQQLPTAGLHPLQQPLQAAAKALFPGRCRTELRELWRQFRQPAADPAKRQRKETAKHILAAVCRRYLIPVVPAVIVVCWDVLRAGVPITPFTGAWWLYFLISLGTGYVFMFTLWFVWEAHGLAQQLAAAYPLGDNLWHTYHCFRMLVAPFIELAFLTALVFAGVVISRSSFFDHWEWSFLHYLFFSVIAGLLLYLTYDDHRQWHVRMCAARQRILNSQSPTDSPNEEQRRALDLIQAVPTWPWNPMQPLRILVVLLAPLVVALLQNYPWARKVWDSVGQLLGSK